MKTFSLGFILASIRIAYLHNWHLNSIKVFLDNIIVILPSYLIIIFIIWSFILSLYKHINYRLMKYGIVCICKFVVKFYKYFKSYKLIYPTLNKCIKEKKKVFNSKSKAKKLNWQCLLIDGAWGSGKTTHYETYYKYIDANPNIYISCFSASRSELIAQIIQKQFLWRLLTLNGLLARLMESNWQIFMPKNRVVVFDDLERLHASEDNYLDLIGVIDCLKTTNKCQVILIADISKTPQIFNSYLERIVDEILDWQPCKINELLPEDSTIFTQQLANYLAYHSSSGFLENRRIIKNILLQINDWALTDNSLKSNDNKFYSSMIVGQIKHNISFLIKWHYLYFNDHNFFVSLANEIHDEFMRYKLGQIKKLNPSAISLKKENDIMHFFQDAKYSPTQIIPPDSAYDFGVHYLSKSTQDKCSKYEINDVEIRYLAGIYHLCVNKVQLQLKQDFYDRLDGDNLSANKNKVTFSSKKIFDLIIRVNNEQSYVKAIFQLSAGVQSLISLVTKSNYECKLVKSWFLQKDESCCSNLPTRLHNNQEFVDYLIRHPEICNAIQEYKEYLRIKFQQFHNIEELQTKLLNSPDHSFIILGILYFVDSDVYKSIIKRTSSQIKQYVDNREPWLNENFRIYFNQNDNILLWCFNGANSDIATEISQVYTTILNDVGLPDVNNK